jgi:NADH-quinone oxidoreductase subunit H
MNYILLVFIKIIVLFAWLMLFALYATLAERKVSAVIQDRHGANRAKILGISSFGIFQPFADALKMLFKEDYIPPFTDKFMFKFAPVITFFFSALVIIAIPFGEPVKIGKELIKLQVIDPDIALLLIFALSSMSIYGIILGGWSSNNKYSFLGGMRASSQIISYEVALILSVIGLIIVYPSLRLSEIVQYQSTLLWGWIPKWGIFLQPLAFIIFIIAAIAETKRAPFDLPESESEIIGFFLEYSGIRFGVYMLTDFVETIMLSLLIATLFLGGWNIPYLFSNLKLSNGTIFSGFLFPWGKQLAVSMNWVSILQIIAFQVKTIIVFVFLLLVRWTFPRLRFDQLMELGWKSLVPLALFNIVVTSVIIALL